jgi:hypothetical protein
MIGMPLSQRLHRGVGDIEEKAFFQFALSVPFVVWFGR